MPTWEARAEELRRHIRELKADLADAEDREWYDEAEALRHDLDVALEQLKRHRSDHAP